MPGVFLPAGKILTLTAGAVTAGSYYLAENFDSYVPVAAGASSVVGPFGDPRQYQVENLTAVVSNSTLGSYAPLANPTFSGTVSMASGAKQVLDHGTGTEAANAVTINAQSGVITTSALTTAASSSYLVTMTNSKIVGTGSIIIASVAGGTNTVKDISVEAICTAANTATLTIYNNVLITTALNGTVKINFIVV